MQKTTLSATVTKFIFTSSEEALKPVKATKFSTGYDLMSAVDCILLPNQTAVIPTGVRMSVQPLDMPVDVQVRARSGLSAKGILLVNAPGTIDADYTDEIGVILHNLNSVQFPIAKYTRIAQLVIGTLKEETDSEHGPEGFVLIDGVKRLGASRLGGFGSTGR